MAELIAMNRREPPTEPQGPASSLDEFRRLMGDKQIERALPHALRVIEEGPDEPWSYHPALGAMLGLGLFFSADLMAQALIDRGLADDQVHAELARAQFWSQRGDKAFATLARALAMYPDSQTLSTVKKNLEAARARRQGSA